MTIDLGEYTSEKALEWAAAWYELSTATSEYVSSLYKAGTSDSAWLYAVAAQKAESAAWYRMADLFEGEFTP